MKALEDFRITGDTSYAPSLLSAGFTLIWIGLCLIVGYMARSPKRIFYYVQARLVWYCFKQRSYAANDALLAWALCLCIAIGIIGLAIAINWLNAMLL